MSQTSIPTPTTLPSPRYLAVLVLSLLASVAHAAGTPKPLKVLLIMGGCCHDYEKQKDILKTGLEQRLHVVVDHMHTPDKSVKPPIGCLTNPDYAAGYDLVIHDECAAGIDDSAQVRNVLHPHRAGIPRSCSTARCTATGSCRNSPARRRRVRRARCGSIFSGCSRAGTDQRNQ